MREIDVNQISEEIRQAVQTINFHTPEPVMIRLTGILTLEPSPAGREAMQDIVENRQVAALAPCRCARIRAWRLSFWKLGRRFI
jgi:tartrate dehydratase alpha subunit/fumarate hydratase class I-like protein